jgi:hypothetical protein
LGDELEQARANANKVNQQLRDLRSEGKGKTTTEHRIGQQRLTDAETQFQVAKNRLEAERRAQGITHRQLYDRLRGRTPNAEMNRVAASRLSPYAAGSSADHVVPVIDIVEMPGFERLPPEMQGEILNSVPENTLGLDPRANYSKGDKLWSAKPGSRRYWSGSPDFGLVPPEIRQEMIRAEAGARVALQKAIDERLGKLGLSR